MFSMPSPANLIISTLVFVFAGWWIRRALDEQGIPAGMTRGLLVFLVASIASCGAGAVVDQFSDHPAQASSPANQIIDDLQQPQATSPP